MSFIICAILSVLFANSQDPVALTQYLNKENIKAFYEWRLDKHTIEVIVMKGLVQSDKAPDIKFRNDKLLLIENGKIIYTLDPYLNSFFNLESANCDGHEVLLTHWSQGASDHLIVLEYGNKIQKVLNIGYRDSAVLYYDPDRNKFCIDAQAFDNSIEPPNTYTFCYEGDKFKLKKISQRHRDGTKSDIEFDN